MLRWKNRGRRPTAGQRHPHRLRASALGVFLLLAARAGALPQSGDGVVRFVYVDATANTVHLVGDFNGWIPTATPLDREADGTWVAQVFLDPGTYEYKFFVDGAWRVDPDNPELSENGNSLLRVGPNGTVLPLGSPSGQSGGEGGARQGQVRWFVRYLGFFTARRDPELERWDLLRPLHDVDLRLEADVGDELSGWFLANINNLDEGVELSRTSLRYDRGVLLWKPREFDIRLFDNEGVTDFEDPGKLIGAIGIYDDSFGYGRRGLLLRRRILGAPLEFVFADDTEPEPDSLLAPVLPALETPPPVGTSFQLYAAEDTRRNADSFAFRLRAGKATSGVGFGYRLDRGAAPGFYVEGSIAADAQGAFATGRQFETTESWDAWSVDLRLQRYGVQGVAEFMSGDRRAVAQRLRALEEARYDSTTGTVVPVFGPRSTTKASFDLDASRRVVVTLAPVLERSDREADLRNEYEEHDFTALVTGTPFLARRHAVGAMLQARWAGITSQLDVEQHWFENPAGATWESQVWFRQHNFWLDEGKAGYERFPLLGAERGSHGRLELSRPLWAARDLQGSLRCTYASPGFERAPRYLETVLRFSIDLIGDLELRTHSRFATFRRFESGAPEIVDLLGPGKHIEVGSPAALVPADASHDYKTYGAHFLELVHPITARSDIALGFGVDPYVVYAVRNTYMDIGWDEFLFDAGASPGAAFTDPVGLGKRIEAAERELEAERRITVEARLHF